ncbi:MAG: hypothetical protein RR840_02095 [Clostridium sp.]
MNYNSLRCCPCLMDIGDSTPNYLTSKVTNIQAVSPNGFIVYGPYIDACGMHISHQENSEDFFLQGGQTYKVSYTVNGSVVDSTDGMHFALIVNNVVTETGIDCQNLSYNSGWAEGYVVVPTGQTYTIKIKNTGQSNIMNIKSFVSISQVTNNSSIL